MKILATGDLHGDVKRSKDLADLAAKEKVDIVLLGGDIVNAQRDPTNMIGPFKQKNLKVGFVWGNHDGPELADFWQNAYKITSLHGYGFMVGDVGFFGCGGANVGLEQLSEEEIFAYLKKGFDKVKNAKVKVMITHVH